MESPYSVLGVKPTDTIDIIKSKYRTLARKYHPDSPGGDPQKFDQVRQAWVTIDKYHSDAVVLKKDAWIHRSFFKIYKEE